MMYMYLVDRVDVGDTVFSMSCTFQVPPKQPAVADNEMFLLDGFDDDQLYANEQVDGGQERGNPLAFPQSDDEEISTDGRCVVD